MSQLTVQSCSQVIEKCPNRERTHHSILKRNGIRKLLLLSRSQSEPRMPFIVSLILTTEFQKVQVTYVYCASSVDQSESLSDGPGFPLRTLQLRHFSASRQMDLPQPRERFHA